MKTSKWIWFIWLLVALCYVVPYGFLSDVEAWYGSFLFWSVIGVMVVATNILITTNFEEY